jgi:hypothetical protein
MAIRPVVVDKRSPFLGEACALCKQPFGPGDEIAICPEDATRHHVHCWRANGDKCTAYGCTGYGEVVGAPPFSPTQATRFRPGQEDEAKVQTLPTRSFHCAQSCLIIAIAMAIILIAIGCFGLWAIADYIMIEVLGWQYRDPVTGIIPMLNSGAIGTGLISLYAMVATWQLPSLTVSW